MTLNCKGSLVDLEIPKVMGIINLSPDSFYEGGRHAEPGAMLQQTELMLAEGATFIDVGGCSSRPGAKNISEEEELQRIVPPVRLLLQHFPDLLLSVDTVRASVAKLCLDLGVAMINDISAGSMDSSMMQVIGEYKVPYILMHMKGNPQNMKELAHYQDLIGEIAFYFSERLAEARAFGITDCILDPGFGFAKTLEQNYELLNGMEFFNFLEKPVLVGLSRKSMVYRVLKTSPEEALNGTTALHMVALQKGASVLRVHDVREAVETISLYRALYNTPPHIPLQEKA